MENLRKRLETSLPKAVIITLAVIFMAMLIIPFTGNAQDSAIRYIREKDENGTPRLRKVEFWDTQKNVRLRAIDLINDNPFNSMGWTRKGGNFDYRQYDLKGKLISDFFPPEVLAGYYPERRHPEWPLLGGSVSYEISSPNTDYLAIDYYASLSLFEALGGILNRIVVLDKKGKEIRTIPKYDRLTSDLGISNNGRYISHVFSAEDQQGNVYPEGYRILDIEKNKYFNLEEKGAKKSLITGNEAYLVIEKAAGSGSVEEHFYRFDLAKGTYFQYQLRFNNAQEKWETMSLADLITTIEKFYKTRVTPEETMVWKNFEPYWK